MSWGSFGLGFGAGCAVVGLIVGWFAWQAWKDVEGRR